MRNNRIGVNGFLNQPCALIPDLESIMRARMRKIVLQQNRHEAADRGSATSRQILRIERTCHGRRGTAKSVKVSDAGPMTDGAAGREGRRRKTSKGGNRAGLEGGGAAGAMGI